jgi:hypothetical protein
MWTDCTRNCPSSRVRFAELHRGKLATTHEDRGGRMRMAECEQAVRHLCHVWASECGIPSEPKEQPSWTQFKLWLQNNHYSHYLNFRSTTSAEFCCRDLV